MSNFDDNNDKDDKKQNDPFEFFKLSSEPSKDGKNEKNNKKKLPVWLILTIAMVLFVGTCIGEFNLWLKQSIKKKYRQKSKKFLSLFQILCSRLSKLQTKNTHHWFVPLVLAIN